MERSGNQEVKIVHWKLNNNNWNVDSFMEKHPDYQEADETAKCSYWKNIFALADQLGFNEDMMQKLFGKKPEYRAVDLVFAMYLVRLYGMQAWEEFFGYKKTMNQGEVHRFLKNQEGLAQEPVMINEKNDTNSGKTGKNGNPNDAGNHAENAGNVSEEDLKECIQNLKQLLDQHEAARKEYEKTVRRLCALSEKTEARVTGEYDQSKADVAQKSTVENTDSLKKTWKLEKEVAVLKTQLGAEKREADLRYDAAMEMKRIEYEHLKEQMHICLQDLEKLRQENWMLKQKNISGSGSRDRSDRKIFGNRRKKTQKQLPMDERQKLVTKILGGAEYPDYLKVYIEKVYQEGMDLERMQTFDNPKLDLDNFEMMKAVVEK